MVIMREENKKVMQIKGIREIREKEIKERVEHEL